MWGVQATVGVSPATRGSAGLFPQETRRPAPLRLLASLYYGDRFHFITVYITCTTVASRVAANTCDTHLRFLTKPLSFSCLASSPFLDSAERPCNKKSFRRHGLVNNCLLVPSPKANSTLFVPSPIVAENPFATAKGISQERPPSSQKVTSFTPI